LSCRSLLFTFHFSLVTALMEQDCLFCRIVAGEIPSDIIYQDERSIAFRDTNPQAPVHVLVIPREHMESLDEASQKDEAMLGHLLRVAARVANEQGLSESGYRTVINTGAGAGQSVFHLHVHVLGGRSMNWPPG
jgi:histidine triad (HIT) family protein